MASIPNIEIDDRNLRIYLSANFAKRAKIYGTSEYKKLQKARQDYPEYEVKKRIKRNPNKNTFANLTYDKMENHILKSENAEENHRVFEELKEIAKAANRGTGYPTVKKWFLKMYPEYASFNNMFADENQTEQSNSEKQETVKQLQQNQPIENAA